MLTPAAIRDIRRRLGLTQADLGALLGVRQTTVSAWELWYKLPDAAALKRIRRLVERRCVVCGNALPLGSLQRARHCSVACAMPRED